MIRKVAVLLMTSGSLLQADPLTDGVTTFRQAYQHWDCAQFWNASRDFHRAVTAKPKSAAAHSWLGSAHFHRMLQIESRPMTPKLQAAAAGEHSAAVAALKQAVKLDARQAEAHAMLGTLYGMKIDGVMSGIRHGRSLQKHQKQALKHGAKNPRVQYLLGVGRLRTAKTEADLLEAVKTLLLAEALYKDEAKQPRAANAPIWGRDACLAFIGEAFSQLHKPAKARDYYRKALALRPSNHMAKAGLGKLK